MKRKNNKLLGSLAFVLIVFGSFLEIYYYAWRFQNDGIPLWLAWIIGIALTAALTMAVYHVKRTFFKIAVICLAVFSVFSTSAGQEFSSSTIERIDAVETSDEIERQEEIAEIKDRIVRINNTWDKIQANIDETITSLHDRGSYRTTLAAAEAEQDELTAERERLESRLQALRAETTGHAAVEKVDRNIYIFYSELFGWSRKWLKLILQTFLSVLIAGMAPLGILSLRDWEPPPEKIKKKKIREYIESFVSVGWSGKRAGNIETLLSEKVFLEFMKQKGLDFPVDIYNKIKKAAIECNILDKLSVIHYTESEAIKKLNKIL